MTNLDSILKSRDITLPTKVRLFRAMVFPGSVLEGYTFLGIRPFLPSCPFIVI